MGFTVTISRTPHISGVTLIDSSSPVREMTISQWAFSRIKGW